MQLNDFLITQSAKVVKDNYLSGAKKEVSTARSTTFTSQLSGVLTNIGGGISSAISSITSRVGDFITQMSSSFKITNFNKAGMLKKLASSFIGKKIPKDLL